MKKLLALLTILFCGANASERVTMTCKLDAIASGYVDKSYSVNLILNNKTLYNQDGGTGPFQRKAIYGSGELGHEFHLYDGSAFRGLTAYDWEIGKIIEWSLNVGTVACVMTKGWASEKYSDNKTVVYVHDTVIKIVKDSILDSSKATQRFSLRGKYVGLAANETDCEFYTHFLKYNDSVFNENGEYVDSFEIKLLYTSGSYYKTIKLERATLLTLMGHPAIYPTRKGNYYITTERNWNEESVKDWSKVKPSSELQKQIDRLRSEIGEQ